MKGTATFILTDSATGEEVARYEEQNMVTDALKNIFTLPETGHLHGMNGSECLKNFLPMWKKLLGGIMLLGNTVEEKSDNILLPSGFVPVGSAGGVYAGTNTFLGTLNENESYPTEKGYHFTWDFPTDKANGIIRCACLTSRLFGDTGFGTNTDGYRSLLMNMYNGESASSPQVLLLDGHGHLGGCYKSGEFVTLGRNGNNMIVMHRYKDNDPKALLINDSIRSATAWSPSEAVEVATPFPVYHTHMLFTNPDNHCVYFFGIESGSDDEHTLVRYFSVSCDSFSIEEQGSVEIPKVGSLRSAAIYGKELYFVRDEGCAVYDMNGSLRRIIPLTNVNGAYLFVYGGQMMITNSDGSLWYYVYCNGDNVRSRGTAYSIHSGEGLLPPYVYICDRSDSNGYIGISMLANYMATINNLSEPIEKSSAHALKIVYDIENE